MASVSEGLVIVGVGIGGVFVNLLVLMLILKAIGGLFGKKKQNKKA